MYDPLDTANGSHAVGESLVEPVVNVEAEMNMEGVANLSERNEVAIPTPDSVDSTPTIVERRRTVPSVFRHRSMDEALRLGLRQNLDKLWASFFYEANVALNVVRHPAFVKAVKETTTAGFVYQPPSYNAVYTKIIGVKKATVTSMVSERTRNSINQYGATICSDGWSDTHTRGPIRMQRLDWRWSSKHQFVRSGPHQTSR